MNFRIMVVAAALACGSETQNGAETQNAGTGELRAPTRRETTADSAGLQSSASSADSAASSLPKVTVLFFGTSLTAGYGLDPSKAFPNQVAQRSVEDGVPIVAINAGLSGETSAGAVRRIDWALSRPVDIVVLETGGNDALRALDADSLETNLRAIVGRTRSAQPKARILLVVMEAPPNLGPAYTARFRRAYVDVARSENLTLVPFLLDSVAGRRELNQADGVHPNEKGERIVAENVWRALRPVVEEVYAQRRKG
jgi:acyl-CoA thioesterase-1